LICTTAAKEIATRQLDVILNRLHGSRKCHYSVSKSGVHVMPFAPIVTRRKNPSTALQEKLMSILGIETKLDGEPVYQSLVARLANKPDPDELLAKMQRLMATIELPLLYTEPNDEEEEDLDSY